MNTLFDLPPKPPPPPPREDSGAEEKRDFRRNLIGVAIGHALILLVLFCAGIFQKEPKREEILWLNERLFDFLLRRIGSRDFRFHFRFGGGSFGGRSKSVFTSRDSSPRPLS